MKHKEKVIAINKGTRTVIDCGEVKVVFNANGGIHVHGDVPVIQHPAGNGSTRAKPKRPLPGQEMEDNTIYVGISPDSGEALYVAPHDASPVLPWGKAKKYAERLEMFGHSDWRLPTRNELKMIFEKRAKIGGFDEGENWDGYGPFTFEYWSSTEYCEDGCGLDEAWTQSFRDGDSSPSYKSIEHSIRPVRSETCVQPRRA